MYIKLSSCILNDAYIKYFIFPANVNVQLIYEMPIFTIMVE